MWSLHLGGTMRIIDNSSWGRGGHSALFVARDTRQPDDPAAPPTRATPPPWTGVPPELVALLVLAPLLALALLAVLPPGETAFRLMQLGCLAQPVLVVLLLLHRAHGSAGHPTGGGRAAEVEARRDQDCLHEVRATVAGIGATHRLLRDRHDRLSGATRSRLERLYDGEIARLERLLDNDPHSPEHETVAVNTAIAPVVDAGRLLGQTVAWNGTDVYAVGRSDDVAEIVHILLDNAARHAPGAEVSVWVESTPTTVLVRVSDDGPGIPDALAQQLFERGVRGPESPGEGIGLHIARRLALEMGGDLVLSRRAGGARFTLIMRAVSETVPCLARRS
jgi:signal transduction histidine kinase